MVRLGNELIYSLGDSLVLVIGRKWAGFTSVCCVPLPQTLSSDLTTRRKKFAYKMEGMETRSYFNIRTKRIGGTF